MTFEDAVRTIRNGQALMEQGIATIRAAFLGEAIRYGITEGPCSSEGGTR